MTDTGTGKPLWTAKFGDERPSGVEFTADGKMVAVSTRAGTVRLFDDAGKPAGVLKADATELIGVAVSPKGDRVVAESTKGELIAWDRATGKILWQDKGLGSGWPAFSPDGKLLVRSASSTTQGGHTVNPADGVSPGTGGKEGAYFANLGQPTCSTFQPDGKAVAFGTLSGTICLFDPITCKPLTPFADPPDAVWWKQMRFTPDGKTVYGFAGGWFAWDVATGQGRRVTNTGWQRDTFGLRVAPLSPDGKHTFRVKPIRNRDDDARLEICNAATGEIQYSHLIKEFLAPDPGLRDFTPDGKAIVSSKGGVLAAWSVDTGKELFRLRGPSIALAYAFSADGRVLVTAGQTASRDVVHVYDLKAGKELAEFDTGAFRAVSVSVSADGGRVAAGWRRDSYVDRDGREPNAREIAVVWDVASGKELVRVSQEDANGLVALSPDGRTLAVSRSSGMEIRIWEVASGTERFRFRHDHCDNPIDALAFAPDGRTLASASLEAPIYLWDMRVVHFSKIVWKADAVWNELALKDARWALNAFRRCWSNPEKVVAFLKERTKDWVPEAGDADRFRIIRAVEVVEGFDTPEAKALLESWAKSAASPVLASEAKAALARTKMRAR